MKDKYDVVIIGAGMAGLVCGSYLARAKLKVLIVEQHNKPGGYCTSFKRGDYKFDVGVHYFGGLKKGVLQTVLKELYLKDKIKFNRFDPTDKIMMPGNTTYVRKDPRDTMKEFQKSFPKEKNNIEKFFKFSMQKDFMKVYARTKGKTFKELVDEFFLDNKLKSTLGVLITNIGATPSCAAAFPSMILLRQYSFDPGYYPVGGIQAFPDMLSQYIQDKGGNVILSKKVVRIITKNKTACGVVLEDGVKIKAKIILSNADVSETFKELLKVNSPELLTIKKMETTQSMFIVYLGVEANLKTMLKDHCNVFYYSSYDVDKVFNEKNIVKKDIGWFVCCFATLHDSSGKSNKNAVIVMTSAPYKSANYWRKNKNILCDKILNKVEELGLIPNLKKNIKMKFIGTPHTLYKYTNNMNGAFAGCLPSVRQVEKDYIGQESSVRNLYLAGHWCSTGYLHFGGIPNVVFLGRRAADLIIEKLKEKC